MVFIGLSRFVVVEWLGLRFGVRLGGNRRKVGDVVRLHRLGPADFTTGLYMKANNDSKSREPLDHESLWTELVSELLFGVGRASTLASSAIRVSALGLAVASPTCGALRA